VITESTGRVSFDVEDEARQWAAKVLEIDANVEEAGEIRKAFDDKTARITHAAALDRYKRARDVLLGTYEVRCSMLLWERYTTLRTRLIPLNKTMLTNTSHME
jgi:hypothetical protein